MKKTKLMMNKNQYNTSEDENVIKNFFIVSAIIIIIVGIVYGVTELLKDKEETQESVIAGEINYDKVSVGMILNRPYDEYYVLAYGADEPEAVMYSTILTKYMEKSSEENYIKIYFCDLDNKLNEEYYNVNEDNKSNPKAKDVKDFDFGDLTLLQIKNGKITKYIEDFEEIKAILK